MGNNYSISELADDLCSSRSNDNEEKNYFKTLHEFEVELYRIIKTRNLGQYIRLNGIYDYEILLDNGISRTYFELVYNRALNKYHFELVYRKLCWPSENKVVYTYKFITMNDNDEYIWEISDLFPQRTIK